jgi:hypothetical protein
LKKPDEFIDAHRRGGEGEGVRGGIKVDPPSKIFVKLVNKNAIKPPKIVPVSQNFHNPYIPFLPKKFGKNLMDPPFGLLNRGWILFQLCLPNPSLKVSNK